LTITSFWDKLEAHHEQAVFLVLVGFLGSFAFIRMSTRIIRSESISWWPGNVESESGLHIHHLVFGIVAIAVALVLVCLAKGRILHAVTGVFIAPIALYGAWRIGKPNSIWARRRYDSRRPHKQAKAEERFAPQRRTERFKEAFRDIVGGKPSKGLAAVRDEASAAAREAGLEVRAGAQRISHAGEAARRDRTRGD
jgi:hypothetical protein